MKPLDGLGNLSLNRVPVHIHPAGRFHRTDEGETDAHHYRCHSQEAAKSPADEITAKIASTELSDSRRRIVSNPRRQPPIVATETARNDLPAQGGSASIASQPDGAGEGAAEQASSSTMRFSSIYSCCDENVSQASGFPVSSPLRSHVFRCSEEPCVQALWLNISTRHVLQAIVSDSRRGGQSLFEIARLDQSPFTVGMVAPDTRKTICL